MKFDSIHFRYNHWSLLLAMLTALVGTGLSWQLHSRIAQSEATTASLTAKALQTHTERGLDRFVEVLESVRALHALSEEINQAAMSEFIEKGLVHQQTVLGAFGLSQRIDHPLRLTIEGQDTPGPGAYNLVKAGPAGSWIPADTRTLYYPLTWQSRINGLNIPIGFDFLSTLAARRAIGQMEYRHHTVLVSEPLSEELGGGYWVFSPISESPRSIIGCSVAVLQPKIILQKVASMSAIHPSLKLTLSSAPMNESIRLADKAWIIRTPIRAIGTQWAFECSLPVASADRRSTAVFAAGLVITALMSCLLLVLANRTRRIEAIVKTRTEDLHAANTQLEENLHERARMEEEMNELTARERRRIGRDLHDSLGQKLTGAVFLSRSLLNHLKHSEGEQNTHAKTLNETLKSSVSQVRNMARGLASVTLNDESLEESLDQLADEMSALYKTSCRVEHSGKLPKLNRKTKEQIYFIVREAVNNAARHAQPSQIIIRLSGNDSGWTVQIEDDGNGLSENKPTGEGMGLRIMRYRARRLEATFAIHSTSGEGTTVEVKSKT